MDAAFKNFFKQYNDFPKFKSKHKSKERCKFINSVHFDFKHWKVKISKVCWVKLCKNNAFNLSDVKLCTLTISMDKCGEYWCTILIEDCISIPSKTKVEIETAIDVDLGIKDFGILSDSTKYHNPKYYEISQMKLKRLQ